jgi:hypothetical protein
VEPVLHLVNFRNEAVYAASHVQFGPVQLIRNIGDTPASVLIIAHVQTNSWSKLLTFILSPNQMAWISNAGPEIFGVM